MVRTRAAGAARLHSHAGAWERENGREIVLRKTAPRNMETAGRISGTVIQALRWMGKNAVDDDMIRKLRRLLPDDGKAILRHPERNDGHGSRPSWSARGQQSMNGCLPC